MSMRLPMSMVHKFVSRVWPFKAGAANRPKPNHIHFHPRMLGPDVL
jgi:branched-subunit amino acid transport protein AzlD